MAEREEEELYCLCRRPYQDTEFMIECDVCKDWFHGSCVGIEEHQAIDIDKYHCPNCQPEHGPLTLKRRRNWHRHDYSEINDGKKAIQCGTVVFVKNLKKKKFKSADGDILFHMKGSEITLDYFEKNGFNNPLIVDKKDGLGLKVPSRDFSIADVERCVGSMRELDVIDVSRQDDMKMKMREWTDYYEDTKARRKVLNVISLEFTGTELAKLVTPPSVVRKIDWINNHWPDNLPQDSPLSRPMVQKYCLMGVKDSYTDFHVDFGGTSVWYHIVRGEKVFYLIPPTEENLIRYEEWVTSSTQSEVFFGDAVPHCYKATIKEGNTLFIPTGWIHAVLTPQDSLVFGGNFLHRYSIKMQLRIYDIELRLNTPLKFRHPCYEALMWFAAENYLTEVQEYLDEGSVPPPHYLLEGMGEMVYNFTEWTRSRERLKLHGPQIPPNIWASRLIEQLSKVLQKAKKTVKTLVDPESTVERQRRGTANGRKRVSPGRAAKLEQERLEEESSAERQSNDRGNRKVSLKLSVPEAKIMSSSLEESEEQEEKEEDETREEERMKKERMNSSESEGSLHINDETTPSPSSRQVTKSAGRRYKDDDPEWKEYKDGEYVYPNLVDEADNLASEREMGSCQKRVDEADTLWKPQGPVRLMKGSIASSFREKRNAKKRSFEQSMSATASKILKMEQEREEGSKEEMKLVHAAALPPRNRQTDPILGGGALKVEVSGEGGGTYGEVEDKIHKARAAAAANAVDAVFSASRPKSRLLTPKQRLGKILGLNKTGRRKI